MRIQKGGRENEVGWVGGNGKNCEGGKNMIKIYSMKKMLNRKIEWSQCSC